MADDPRPDTSCPATSRPSFSFRRNLPQLAVGLVCHDVERAILPLPYVPDAVGPIGEEALFAGHPPVLHGEPDEEFILHSANEKAPAPGRERVSGVELGAGGRDDGIPVVHGLLVAGP